MTVTPADRGPQVSAVAGLFFALSTIGIILRCYCRAVVVRAFGMDDWFAVIAWVSHTATDLLVRVEILTISSRYSSLSFAHLLSLACTTEPDNMLQTSHLKTSQLG
jgi:hypothetical protein